MNHRLHVLPGLLLALVLLGLAWMALPLRPASTAYAQLPPRPTLTPTPVPATATPTALPLVTPTAVPVEHPVRIRLLVDAGYEGAWSLVQWQDGQGDWHDVSGWLGEIENGQVQWRVLPKDYNTGPFRWIVLDQPGGEILAISASFTLPNPSDPLTAVTVKIVKKLPDPGVEDPHQGVNR
jgi:hypothetical protein